MDHETDVTERLRAIGDHPVPASALARHQGLAAEPTTSRRWSRAAVALAAIAGFGAGSIGLASAGALPDPVQDVAHDVLGTVLDPVGVDIPAGTERFNDPVECPGGPYKNHGDYVKQHHDDPEAAHSNCGKPLVSVHDTDSSDASTESDDTESDDTESDDTRGGSSDHSSSGKSDEAPGRNGDEGPDVESHGPPASLPSDDDAGEHGPDAGGS